MKYMHAPTSAAACIKIERNAFARFIKKRKMQKRR